MTEEHRQELLRKWRETLDKFFKEEQSGNTNKYSGREEQSGNTNKYSGRIDDNTAQGENVKIKIMFPKRQQRKYIKTINELFKGVNNDEEFENRMDQLEGLYTPKYELYQKCREDFRSVTDSFIAGTLLKENALLLLKSKYDHLMEEVYEIRERGGFIIINDIPEEYMKITLGITHYYIEMKLSIESIDKTKQEKDSQESAHILPPVIQAILNEGLLNNTPINGKYTKTSGKKDMDIIKWVVDYSGYEDALSADLYLQYINTNVLPQTIGQYISRTNTEAK